MISNMLQLVIYIQAKYLQYFDMREIDYENTNDDIMVQKYRRLTEIAVDIMGKTITENEIRDKYYDEVNDLHFDIRRKEFICKVSRIAYINSTTILAEFLGDYYVEIDFSEFWEEYPELQKLKDPSIFCKVHVWEYHVRFGPNREVDVTSPFIWNFGKRIKEYINPEDYEWMK